MYRRRLDADHRLSYRSGHLQAMVSLYRCHATVSNLDHRSYCSANLLSMSVQVFYDVAFPSDMTVDRFFHTLVRKDPCSVLADAPVGRLKDVIHHVLQVLGTSTYSLLSSTIRGGSARLAQWEATDNGNQEIVKRSIRR